MGKKDKSKICIMVVPHTKRVVRLTIPRWLPKVTTLTIVTILIIASIVFNSLYKTRLDLAEKNNQMAEEIDSLKEENRNKEIELAKLDTKNKKLYAKTYEVEGTLIEIEKLQRQLEKMAGLQSSSRGGRLGRNIMPGELEPLEEVQIVKEVLDNKEKELEIFIDDIEKRFEHLKTVPDLWPTRGRLTSLFGNRKNPFGRGYVYHKGIDIANSRGTNIWAAGKGKVVFTGYKAGLGMTVIIDHGNGYKTVYGHNSKLLVTTGTWVEKGQNISKMGSTGRVTGTHLHFEVHKNDKVIDPLTILK